MDRFEEIEVRRIRVVDEKGTLRMLLSGSPQPDALFRGEPLIEQNRPEAGLIFYNEEGTECGGLEFKGRKGPDGVEAEITLAFDQYESDMAVILSHSQQGSTIGYGLAMNDRSMVPINELLETQEKIEAMPDGAEKEEEIRKVSAEAFHQRLFMGRLETGEVYLFMMDSKGRPRIRIGIDAEDSPRLEFMDESGQVTNTLAAHT